MPREPETATGTPSDVIAASVADVCSDGNSDARRVACRIRAMLLAAGWKIVPIVPTLAMLDAADVNGNPYADEETRREEAGEAWSRMIGAADVES